MRITVVQVPERRPKTYFIMKKLFFCAAALLAAASFSACSDNDDEIALPVTSDNIAGTWLSVHEEGWEIDDDGEKYSWSEKLPASDGSYDTYTFNKDGSYSYTAYEDEEAVHSETGTYSTSDNSLVLKSDYCPYCAPYDIEIKKLTESRLVLVEGGSDWGSSTTYKRID